MDSASLAISSYLLISPSVPALVFSFANRVASSEAFRMGPMIWLRRKTTANAEASSARRTVEAAMLRRYGRRASCSSRAGRYMQRMAVTAPAEFFTGTMVVMCGCCPSEVLKR